MACDEGDGEQVAIRGGRNQSGGLRSQTVTLGTETSQAGAEVHALGTVNIQGWIILCGEPLSCAWQSV